MNRTVLILLLLSLAGCGCMNLFASDTLYIQEAQNSILLYNHITVYQDIQNQATIEDILSSRDKYPFGPNKNGKLNFGFSRATIWLRLIIKNDTEKTLEYIMEISNPDLDYIDFYKIRHDSIISKIQTGELRNVGSRALAYRNFLFPVSMEPEDTLAIYMSVYNSGHSCTIPVKLLEDVYFEKEDNKIEIMNWLVYGLLIFMIIFSIYLYHSSKDKVNLYYGLSLVFAVLFLLHYEGYFFYLNPPLIVERLKWISPCLYTVFLLLFTRDFVASRQKIPKISRYIGPLIIFVLLAPFARNLGYPFSLITDIGVPVVILCAFVIIIIMALISYRRDYLPSKLFLSAYIVVFIGLLVHQLKEFDFFNLNYLVLNSVKIGLVLQNILFTLTVLERFRINQEEATQTIQKNLDRIEFQNKELEIINTELEKLSIVASETDNSIAIYDNQGKIEWANTGFEKLYGVNLNELIQKHQDKIEDIIPNKNIRRYIDKCLKMKLPIIFETEVETRRNKKIWLQTTLSPYIRAESIHKIIAIDTDITNLKIYEKELEKAKEKAVEADNLKTTFLGNLSHEIRTPLNGILGFSELLNRSELNAEERKMYLDIIKSSGEQLMHIIEDIVDISLIESNQLKIFSEELDLNLLIQEVLDFFESYKVTINKSHIQLISDLKIEKKKFVIVSDSFRLKQVLTNLIKNGFKFTDDGYIKVSTYTKGKLLYFCVEDTGIGIKSEIKDMIFERFRQGEEKLSRKYGGTGLGLSISKGIIEKMGGDIWIDTTYQEGFKIYFTIPFVVKKEKVPAELKHYTLNNVGDLLKNKKILIVEDHAISYKYLEEILLPYKPKLSWAINGEESLNMVRNNKYDLIIMDINLPEMDGVTAIKEIRKTKPDIPILVQTAYAMETEMKMIKSSGCNDIIGKPFNEKEFLDTLIKVV